MCLSKAHRYIWASRRGLLCGSYLHEDDYQLSLDIFRWPVGVQCRTAIPFGGFGALMSVFSLFTIPLWVWGKRLSIATAEWVPSFT